MAIIPERDLQRTADAPELRAASVPSSLDFGEHGLARIQLLWDHRGFLVQIALWGLLLATVVAFLIPKRYQSTTLLMPPDDQSGSGMMMLASLSGKLNGGLGAMAGDLLGIKSSGDLFIGILTSRTIRDDLIGKFNLRRVYGTTDLQSTRQILAENTSISEDRKSGIISITVTDRVPQRSAEMAQEYVSELNLVVSHLTTSSAHRERVFLEERLSQVKQDLENAEKEFSEFASKNATPDIKEQGKAMVQGAATLEGQLIAAQSELQGLKQIYSDNNVRIRSSRARIAELQSHLGQLDGKQITPSDSSPESGSKLYPSIRQLPLLGVPYADLYRRTQIQEAVFDSLTQEYEMAKVQEAKEIPSVKVLDPPNIPERKSFPPRLIIMVLGTLSCFALGAMWLLAKARWDEIHPQAPQKVFAKEVFHSISSSMPWSPPNGSRFQSATHAIWVRMMPGKDPVERN